jgi:CMP-N-acetylneuraminic acid synthetase
MQLQGDKLVPWDGGPPEGGHDETGDGHYETGDGVSGFSRTGAAPTRRQDKPMLFARNGPAVVAVRTRIVTEARTLYGPDTRGLVMPREASFDIDDAFDLEVAERLMASRPLDVARGGA